MSDVTLNGIGYTLVTGDGAPATGMRGAEGKQDFTPSAQQQAQQIPGDTDLALSSIIVYGDATGAWGLSDRLLAPGDQSRPYLTELDNTRARQMTAWVGPSAATALAGGWAINGAFNNQYTLVDAAAGFAFLAYSTNNTYDLWQWNGTAFNRVRAAYNSPAPMYLASYSTANVRSLQGTARPQVAISQDYAGGYWASVSGGLQDLSVAAVAAVGDANSACTCVYLDILFSFGITASGITITPYRFSSGSTPATAGSPVQKVDAVPGSGTFGTFINSTVTIQGEKAINGVIASEGAMVLVTDRSAYSIIWNDVYNTIGFDRLPINVPRFTSAPVAWNGEMWIGAGNQIIHIAPHQGNYDTVLVDTVGNSPSPFSGRVIQLMASPQFLCAMLVDDNTVTPANTVLALRDANGAWFTREYITGNTVTPKFPLMQKIDANGFALVTLTSATTTTQWTLLDAGRNPRNQPVALRAQEGTQRIIFPWEYGLNESALKQLLRCRLQVRDTGAQAAATHIRAYYQFDNTDSTGGDAVLHQNQSFTVTFAGVAKGSGYWQIGADAYQGAVGDYASQVSAGGTGYFWTEFDNAAAAGTATVAAGAITAIVPQGSVPSGSGYTSPPAVYILPTPGFGGSGATATATLNAGGQVSGFTVTAGGAGYTAFEVMVLCVGGKTVNALASGSPWSDGVSFDVSNSAVVGRYPTFRRIRWMIEIGGDTTGTIVPTCAALVFYYNEYPSVGYQFTVRLRIREGDTHAAAGTYANAAAIIAALDALEAIKNNKSITSYTGVDGHTWNVLLTKFTRDITAKNSGGITEAEATVTLQIVALQGVT